MIKSVMSSVLNKLLIVFLLVTGLFSVAGAQDFPVRPNRLVNDYTHTLSDVQISQLERKLVTFDDSTSTQIAVVIMQSTGGYDIADYGVRLAQQWGIGSEQHDNGILLLVALGDRAVTIQTGYGVEGAVPDAIAFRIIENEIKPAFRQGDYYTGIDRATDALIAYTKGEYKADPKQGDGGGGLGALVFIIILVIIVISISGRGGGGGRVMDRRGGSDLLWWTLLSGMGRGNGGGFGGGGSFGGGGGFGGFGGGGFGGGGASGRW